MISFLWPQDCNSSSVESLNLAVASYHTSFHNKVLKQHNIRLGSSDLLSCTPLALSSILFRQLDDDLHTILQANNRLTTAIFGDAHAHAKYLRLQGLQEIFACLEKQKFSLTIARPDLILGRDGLKIVELNVGSGIGYIPDSHLCALYGRHSPLTRALRQEFLDLKFRFMSPLGGFFKLFKGLPSPIFYATSRPTYPDNRLSSLNDYWVNLIKKKSNLDITANKKTLDFDKYRSVFLGFSTYQLEDRLSNKNERGCFQRLLASTSTRLYNPPSSLLQEHKLNLAILSDPTFHRYFTAKEIGAIHRRIPWTRRVRREIGSQITTDRSRYVIKKGADHGGNSVFIGRDMSHREWEALIWRCVEEDNWIVQKIVHSRPQVAGTMCNGQIRPVYIDVLLRPITIGGRIISLHSSIQKPDSGIPEGCSSVAIIDGI